jgi:phosphate transport system permease protein
MTKKDRNDKIFKMVATIFGVMAIVFLVLITAYIVIQGIKPFLPGNENGQLHVIEFLTGTTWDPANGIYGIGYMIIGTILSVGLAIIIAVPIAILAAVGIVEILPKRVANFVGSAIELLAAIPSVIYGVFGLAILVPIIAAIPMNEYPQGSSLLATGILLGIMILPTIIAVSSTAIKAVPSYYKEASLGLGATKIQTIFKVIIPTAKSGITAGVILGIGRAIGETMAVILVAGNVGGGIPTSIFAPIRPLTANIAMDMSYATGLHQQALFATALVLLLFIILLNVVIYRIANGGDK